MPSCAQTSRRSCTSWPAARTPTSGCNEGKAAAVVALLCRLRADLDAKDAEGDSPLSHARYFGAEAIYEVLERQGAKLEGPYYSSLHVAGRRFLGWR
mmetsp:Transcript_7643/g.27995  ORF Transcript_7643/g.27995 Transcript_7643/m.27995 type:complete len:97 (-) Transcript_7643:268-558(-)